MTTSKVGVSELPSRYAGQGKTKRFQVTVDRRGIVDRMTDMDSDDVAAAEEEGAEEGKETKGYLWGFIVFFFFGFWGGLNSGE